MRLIRDLILLAIVTAGVTNCFIQLSAVYDETMRSERVRCVESHRNANWLHIEFQSETHAENWCDAHQDDWRELVNGRVLSAAAKLDAQLDNH